MLPASDDPLRDRLLERISRLPSASLPLLDAYVDLLERLPHASKRQTTAAVETATAVPPATPTLPRRTKSWPHAPLHCNIEDGTYIVTGATLYKEHIFRSAAQLDVLESQLLAVAEQHRWRLEAWAVFSNHYHFVGHTTPGASDLKTFVAQLHSDSAREVNQFDEEPGRKVWYNYWETALTYEKSYYARLNYVHQNPVRHGLVAVANQYRWCSAAWLERTATPAQVATVYSFKIDKVNVKDDFDPIRPDA